MTYTNIIIEEIDEFDEESNENKNKIDEFDEESNKDKNNFTQKYFYD